MSNSTHFTVQAEAFSGETFALRREGITLTGIANLFGDTESFLRDPSRLADLQFTTRDDVPFDGSLSLAWARGEDGPVAWEVPLASFGATA